MTSILGLTGSLRRASASTGLLRAAASTLPYGSSMNFADVGGLPVFNKDLENTGRVPDSVRTFRQSLTSADAFLFSVPEHSFGISGPLMNALDWGVKRYGMSENNVFSGKVMAVIGVGTTATPIHYARHLKDWGKAMNMKIVDRTIYVNRNSVLLNAFDKDGNLINEDIKEDLNKLMEEIKEIAQENRGVDRSSANREFIEKFPHTSYSLSF